MVVEVKDGIGWHEFFQGREVLVQEVSPALRGPQMRPKVGGK